jgi:hypothetical protein
MELLAACFGGSLRAPGRKLEGRQRASWWRASERLSESKQPLKSARDRLALVCAEPSR